MLMFKKQYIIFRNIYSRVHSNSYFKSCVSLQGKLIKSSVFSNDMNKVGHVLQNLALRGNGSLWIKHSLVGYCNSVASTNVSYKELLILKEQKKIFLVDVRELAEIAETGKLPGSTHIPLGELKCALEALSAEEFQRKYGAPKPTVDAAIVFSCKAGIRSVKAMELAVKTGFKNSRSYGGGFMEWSENSKIACGKN